VRVHHVEVRLAVGERRRVEAGARDAAVREVWKAYTDFKTALRKQDSAAELLTASQNAYDSVLESYHCLAVPRFAH
jgi:outer membrane protein TolC